MSVDRFQKLLFRLAKPVDAPPGFVIRATSPEPEETRLIEAKVGAALNLVARYSSLRYGYLQRDLSGILIGGNPAAATHYPTARLCTLRFEYVVAEETTPAQLALSLVHEGMHARLTRYGFQYTPALRARIERLCISSELVFARRLPDRADLVSDAVARLQWPDSTWTTEAINARHIAVLKELGLLGRIGYVIGASWAWARKRITRAA